MKRVPQTWMMLLIWVLGAGTQGLSQQPAYAPGSYEPGAAMEGPWMSKSNPAGMANLKSMGLGMKVRNSFLLPELSEKTVVMMAPVHPGVIGFTCELSGGRVFRQSALSLLFSRRLAGSLAAGVRLNSHSLRSGDGLYRNRYLTFDVAFRTRLARDIFFGVNLVNPYTLRYRKNPTQLSPAGFAAGIMYRLSSQGIWTLDVRHIEDSRPAISTAIRFCNRKGFGAMAGCTSDPPTAFFCISLDSKIIKLDFSAGWHPFLGYSPAVAMLYQTAE